MTEAVHQSSNRRYYAVAAHGFSENFEEEPNFPIIPSSVASGGTAPVVIDYPRVSGVVAGVRKRYIVKYTGTSVKPFEIAPETLDRKSTRLNSSHIQKSRMPSSA